MDIKIAIPSVVVHMSDPHAAARHAELLARINQVLVQGAKTAMSVAENNALLDEINAYTNQMAEREAQQTEKLNEIGTDLDDLIAKTTDTTVKDGLVALRDKAAARAAFSEAQGATLAALAAKYDTPLPPPVEPPA